VVKREDVSLKRRMGERQQEKEKFRPEIVKIDHAIILHLVVTTETEISGATSDQRA
jgi:hypothetical protein